MSIDIRIETLSDSLADAEARVEEMKNFHDKVEILVWGKDFMSSYTDDDTLYQIQKMFS